MEQISPIDDCHLRIPPIVWALATGLIIAFVAIFVFNMAINTVVSYGFFILMMGSHFFIHGAHGEHGGSAGHQHGRTLNNTDAARNDHSGHTGSCH